VLVGTGKFVDGHPEVVAKLLKAQQQAVDWLTQDSNKDTTCNWCRGWQVIHR
jgi:sulfonate transport system substrate-binding protein